jgi:hypothetical protein
MMTTLVIVALLTVTALVCFCFGMGLAIVVSDVLETVGDVVLAKLGR